MTIIHEFRVGLCHLFQMFQTLILVTVYSISIDCPNVITLAKGLNLDVQQPALMTKLNLNCCTGSDTGITCSTNRVTIINWYNLNLNGVINASAIPTSLLELSLGTNSITGPFPQIFPPGLQYMWLFNNMMTGAIPANLPSSLLQIILNYNYLDGPIPNPLPPNLSIFSAYGMSLTGNIPNPLPDTLTNLNVFSNELTGSLPNSLPPNLSLLQVVSNQLTGLMPPLPATLQYLELGYAAQPGNSFSGSISLNQPIRCSINYNWITNIVISDPSQLVDCDISFNPLLEHKNDPSLSRCLKNGLYSAASLPITISTIHSGTSKTTKRVTAVLTTNRSTAKFSTSSNIPNTIRVSSTTRNIFKTSSALIYYTTDGFKSSYYPFTGFSTSFVNLLSASATYQAYFTDMSTSSITVRSTKALDSKAPTTKSYSKSLEITISNFGPIPKIHTFSSIFNAIIGNSSTDIELAQWIGNASPSSSFTTYQLLMIVLRIFPSTLVLGIIISKAPWYRMFTSGSKSKLEGKSTFDLSSSFATHTSGTGQI